MSPFKSRRRSDHLRRTLVLAAVLGVLVLVRLWHRQENPPSPEVLAEGDYTVQRVVDGDTLLLANRGRVRLIGADTPETVKPGCPKEPWGSEATEFTQQFVETAGGSVRLQFDRQRIDQYGRFLAYVWVGERMLNEELIRAGLATARTEFRYAEAMKKRFVSAQQEAQSAARGIWSDAPGPGSSP